MSSSPESPEPLCPEVVDSDALFDFSNEPREREEREGTRNQMRIKQHDRSHIVELNDGSAWRIWPGDTPKTLQWQSTTEIDVVGIEDAICSHALINRSDGSRVRVIDASANWPVEAVRRSLRRG
jgi:hypothetical protein